PSAPRMTCSARHCCPSTGEAQPCRTADTCALAADQLQSQSVIGTLARPVPYRRIFAEAGQDNVMLRHAHKNQLCCQGLPPVRRDRELYVEQWNEGTTRAAGHVGCLLEGKRPVAQLAAGGTGAA